VCLASSAVGERRAVVARTEGLSAITSIYFQGIDNTEIIDTVHARRAPVVPADSLLAH
jgi:hypothetical protein